MKVQCDNTLCNRMFDLTPDSIVTAIPIDEKDEVIEWMQAEEVFCCPRCRERYVMEEDDAAPEE